MNRRGQSGWRLVYPICSVTICCAILMLQCACTPSSIGGNGRSVHNVVRDLRIEREQLLKDKRVLEQSLELCDLEISALKKRLAGQTSKVPVVDSEDFPRVVQIKFNSFSGGIDKDHDGADEIVRVYLVTLDQRGRFFPAIGRAKLMAYHRKNGQKPVLVAQRLFEPEELDKTYRTGFLGSHYRLDAKFDSPLPPDAKDLSVKVVFIDAATGIEFEVSELLAVTAPARHAVKPAKPPAPQP
jgi:hypothetical protein